MEKGSVEAASNSVDLFSLPNQDVTTVSSEISVYYPISNFRDNQNPIQFIVNSSGGHYLDLESARLYLKCKIVKADGTDIADEAADEVAPQFNFLPSLWESSECLLNGHVVSRCSNYYLYRHHIQDLLSFTAGGKENYLAPQIFIPDSPQDTFTALNPGYVKRRALSASSKIFETSGRIVEPVFNQRRWIPPNIEI